ncbi:MAG TPA: O-antigen ligase family protein [Candidatus Krumholzibacteria bacterium]|nr:O-antigen ligase family protein [Candidatus Krumholzibacteria bacterium]
MMYRRIITLQKEPLEHTQTQSQTLRARVDRAVTWAGRIVPAAALVAIGSFFAAQQVTSPNHRSIKLVVMLGIAAFMFRFDMVYAIYAFVVLFPFPTGISIASSNLVLMTVIPMVWAVRAASTKTRLFRATPLGAPHALFIIAYFVSLMNVESNLALVRSLQIIWRQIACVTFFAMIVTFVDDEKRLKQILQLMCVSVGLVMATAIVELIAPGSTIIPGWVGMGKPLSHGGELTARVEKMRIGGALGSDANLADFGTQLLGFMVYFALRAKNPAMKTFWFLVSVLTLVAVLSTGNRGGLVGIMILFGYALYLFRRRMSFPQKVMIVTAALALAFAADYALSTYTYATSPIQRLMNTEMHGVVPETRTMTWLPSLKKCLEHPFVGSGPWFEIGKGLSFQFWPHNAYLFYLQTLGLFGFGAFMWIMWRVTKMSLAFWHRTRMRDDVSDILALAHIWLVVFAVEQLGIDHQREDIYPFLVWFFFAIIVAAAGIIQRRETGIEAIRLPKRFGSVV